MGLGTQMLGWHEDFCTDLAGRGFHVIRYDNRDIGRSTILSSAPVPTLGQILRRDKRAASYTLAEMAADGVGAARPPRDRARPPRRRLDGRHDRPDHRRPAPRARAVADLDHVEHRQPLARPARAAHLPPVPAPRLHRPRDLHRRDRGAVRHHRLARLRARRRRPARPPRRACTTAATIPARSRASSRAILASGDRTAELRHITAPTLVIHGTADKLVAPSGGRATARAIPGARLLMIEGMGHDLPRGAWPQLIDAIVENAGRAATPPAIAKPRRLLAVG